MKIFFMKFLYFFNFVFFGFFSIVFCFVIFDKHDYDLKNWFFLFFSGGMTLLFFWCFVSEEEPEENPKTENLKTDNPENDEIITFTEIKGVKKIIKNGKVIYCEQLKADELKVFEQLKDKKV